MISLEEKLRPQPGQRDVFRDIFNAGLLIAISVLLLPAWLRWGGEFQLDIAGQMASGLLPAAMGFMLALRCGAVDLSIWVVMSAAGAFAAVLMNAGIDPAIAFLAAGLLGLGVGAFNGLLIAGLRIPSFLATAATGLGIIGAMHLLCDGPVVSVPDEAFDGWVLGLSNLLSPCETDKAALIGPLVTVRMLLVAASWTGVLVVLMLADAYARRRLGKSISQRRSLFFSLCGSGVLAGISGMCWLMDLGHVAVATRLTDGLEIPTAVILAGGLLLAGRGRAMLVGICLPLALLLTSAWSQTIWPIRIAGMYAQLPVLLIIVGGVDLAFLWSLNHAGRLRWLAWLACVLCVAGLLTIPASNMTARLGHHRIYLIGLAIWASGIALLVLSVALGLKGRRFRGQTSERSI